MNTVVALSGGVGGARLVHGLSRALDPGALAVIINTGDDFQHWGLSISPDLDTVMYTLADLAHEERGWGLAEESFQTLSMVRRYGGDGWFQLGDRDLATHLLRTQALRRGETLSQVTARLTGALGVRARIVPMADAPCRTMIDTRTHGTLSFQDWFVRERAQPEVRAVRFEGDPPPAPGVVPAIEAADVVIFGPSNPYVSIDPILSLPGVRAAIARRPVVAVSPIVGGLAVKGPLGSMIPELAGAPASAAAIARHYGGLLAGIVVERGDEAGIAASDDLAGLAVLPCDTVMRSRAEQPAARPRGARIPGAAAPAGAGRAPLLRDARGRPTAMSTWALVPAKSFARAKSRLSGVLGERERALLARSMFEHVLGVLASCAEIGGVMVVTDGDDVAEAARALGAVTVRDAASPPLGAIVDAALAELPARRAPGALGLMSDLPLLAAADVEALLARMRALDLVAAPDVRGEGTNALGLTPPDRLRTSFGTRDSLRRHLLGAEAAGLRAGVFESEGLAFDVDEPADLARLPLAMRPERQR